jgi:hypothetical protein
VDAWADAVLAVPGAPVAPADEPAHGLVALAADALLGVRL